ncbi:MAG TPA: Tim44/TimA family putative adaptor protein [Rhizomicrobium sp.]|nr:Tim44/TimA family putative adaptor protein [Rhizomicrobium sp.]
MNAQLLEILFFAMVAGIVLFRLYSVLGRRTGNERPPQENVNARVPNASDNVVQLPDRTAPREAPSGPVDPLQRALLDIKLADKSFEEDHFVSGAKQAFEMIVTAYSAGDRATLKSLVSQDVFAAFDSGITAREKANQKASFTFVGFKNVRISDAALKGRMAEVTVTFNAQYISATTDANGTVVDGDTTTVRDVTDVWTFSRDTRASDPNWMLVATSGDDV